MEALVATRRVRAGERTVKRKNPLSEMLRDPEKTLGRAYHLALRVTGNAEFAEDAVQDACTRLLDRPPADTGRSLPELYLLRAVHSSAVSLLRSEDARRTREEGYAMKNVRSTEPPERAADLHALARTAREVLDGLPSETRVAVALCCEQGLTYREAAEITGAPQATVARRVQRGLDKLRDAVAKASFAAATPAALGAALGELALPSAPAGLVASVQGLASGSLAAGAGAATKGAALAGKATLLAKGGATMKLVAGVVAASALAGAVAVSTGMGRGALPAVGDGKPVPVNPHKGMQVREEIYEFTAKPAVKKEGEVVVITFASKGKCDATVSIVGPDGVVVRHLASGVLGSNAPHPFQQGSLSQKLEWDGLTDMGEKAPRPCKIRVSLGLKAEFEKGLLWHPNDMPSPSKKGGTESSSVITATGKNGNLFVGTAWRANCQAYEFDKAGKYVRTVFPPAAADVEKVMGAQKYKFGTTTWGDKIVIGDWYGPFTGAGRQGGDTRKKPLTVQMRDVVAAIKAASGVEPKETPAPTSLPKLDVHYIDKGKRRGKVPVTQEVFGKFIHMAADRQQDTVYLVGGNGSVFRFDGKTGEIDKGFYPNGEMGHCWELATGPDGLVYTRSLGSNTAHGQWLTRVDRTGKVVPFKEGTIPMPGEGGAKYKGVPAWRWRNKAFSKMTGVTCLFAPTQGHSNTHDRGLYVGPDGTIVTGIIGMDPDWAKKHKVENPRKHSTHVVVWNHDGKLLSPSAIGDAANGHGSAIDRDGNLYAALGGILPKGMKQPHGIKEAHKGAWDMGSIAKFRGQGGKFPLITSSTGKPGSPPADALWLYGGLINQRYSSCTCHHVRWDMDYFARSWVPSNDIFSVMVIDANGNQIARIGRYGNADDADEKHGKIHFAWMRSIGVNDVAMYVSDTANRRILKAALSYHAEEELPLP